MEYVEKGINEVQEHMKESIQRHNESLPKQFIIQQRNQSSVLLHVVMYQKHFQIQIWMSRITRSFNPKAVFEFKQGVATDVIETWDH